MTAPTFALPRPVDFRTTRHQLATRAHLTDLARSSTTRALRLRAAALALRAGAIVSAVTGVGLVLALFQAGITGASLALGILFIASAVVIATLVATSIADLLSEAAGSPTTSSIAQLSSVSRAA